MATRPRPPHTQQTLEARRLQDAARREDGAARKRVTGVVTGARAPSDAPNLPGLPFMLGPREPGTALAMIIGTRLFVDTDALEAAGDDTPSYARLVYDQVHVMSDGPRALKVAIPTWRFDGHTWLSYATWTAIASLYRTRGAPLPAWLQ